MRFLLALVAVLLFAPGLRATVLVPAEFREIVAGSQIIVYGRVVDVRAEWSDDRRRIDTVVSVQAGSYLKGGPASVVTFRVPGGQIGRYKNVMVGAPEFQPGEEAVLFLRARRAVGRPRLRPEPGRLPRAGRCAKRAAARRAAGADGERRRARDRHPRGA